jgi:hypothetical protein
LTLEKLAKANSPSPSYHLPFAAQSGSCTPWRAFVGFAIDEAAAAEVGREMGLSESAVVQAKFRVLKRLREEAGELMD